jgi:fatty-acid peroxygenase
VALPEQDVPKRTRQLSLLFDRAAAVGLGHLHSRIARRVVELWIAQMIDNIRAGCYAPPPDSAAHRVACLRDINGRLLPSSVAAVELINVLRPTVAVAVFIVFAAHALARNPQCRQKVAADKDYVELFVQEVRRLYPFFPAVVALVRRGFAWRGYRFPERTRVMLDLYGTNHDGRIWPEPDRFHPERFREWDRDRCALIPQGGGDFYQQSPLSGRMDDNSANEKRGTFFSLRDFLPGAKAGSAN